MGILDSVSNALTGGLASTIMDGIKSYFPPDMSDEKKAELQLKLENIELQKTIAANKAISDAEASINERISMHEGTAKDLMQLPFVGRILIFLRGTQRPAWGFATMYCDFMWMSGSWSGMTDKQESTLWVINFLVLGFLFGERAIKNVMPIIAQYIGKK